MHTCCSDSHLRCGVTLQPVPAPKPLWVVWNGVLTRNPGCVFDLRESCALHRLRYVSMETSGCVVAG